MVESDKIIQFIELNRGLIDRIIDLVPIPLFVKDSDGRYIDCNTAFQNFFSFQREDIIGKTVYDIWPKKEADIFFAQDKKLLDRGGLQIYESAITTAQDTTHIVQFHKQTFSNSFGTISGFLGVIFDITEKKLLEDCLANLATTDELTGLVNRREGMARLEILHKDSKRKNRPYCLSIVDLDDLKTLNDRHGHVNGDFVLKAFSKQINQTLRASDICFRFGGDEFVILLPETKISDGLQVLERLRQTWSATPLTLQNGQTVKTTISIGLIHPPKECIDFRDLIDACDKALYEAKKMGRNCIVCA